MKTPLPLAFRIFNSLGLKELQFYPEARHTISFFLKLARKKSKNLIAEEKLTPANLATVFEDVVSILGVNEPVLTANRPIGIDGRDEIYNECPVIIQPPGSLWK